MNGVIQIIAHRGCSGDAPENTLAAFRLAMERQCDMIELDVRFSRDLAPVVIHDSRIDRTTGGRGRVSDLTLVEMARLDAGSWFDARFQGEGVPSLAQVLDLVRGKRTGLLIELKESAALLEGCRRVVREIQVRDMQSQCVLQSFEHEALRRLRSLDPALTCAALFERATPDYIGEAEAAGATIVGLSRKLLGELVVDDAHRRGLQLFVWTVNEPADIARAISLEVDGIITNFPDRVVDALREWSSDVPGSG